MKILTLNTHSWIEEAPIEKFELLLDHLFTEDYDVIALQEVNQRLDAPCIKFPTTFCQVEHQVSLRADNFAYCLVQRLREKGLSYYFGWQMSHIGYDLFEEGNAILAKKPFIAEAITVSPQVDPHDYRTRVNLVATFVTSSPKKIASCHFSWWETKTKGFAVEWEHFVQRCVSNSRDLIVCGDFNNPALSEGYQQILESETLRDSYQLAKTKQGEATILKKIDGWEQNTTPLRIDYIFVPDKTVVTRYQRVLDGEHSPIVSDHFGIQIELEK